MDKMDKAVSCTPCLEAVGNWDLLCFPRDSRAYGLDTSTSTTNANAQIKSGNWSIGCWNARDKKWTFPESNLPWQVWSMGRCYKISQVHVHVPGEQPLSAGELHVVFDQAAGQEPVNKSMCTLTLAIPLSVCFCTRNNYEASLLTETGSNKKWDWNRIGSLFRNRFVMWTLLRHQHIQAQSPLFISRRDLEILRSNSARSPRAIAPEDGYGLPLVIGVERMVDVPPSG